MRILLKFPSRGRPQQFLKTLRGWLDNADDLSRIAVLVSYDADDATMTDAVIEQAQAMHPALVAVKGNSKTKIQACNADLNEYKADWDVVLLISDDMFCRRKGWDSSIRESFNRFFPDTNGALWHFDGAQKKINTLECVGRARYREFGYLYHPDYSSFWSDNESTAVGLNDHKLIFIEHQICSHEHPSWLGGMKNDSTYQRNHKYWAADQATYERRKSAGFPR